MTRTLHPARIALLTLFACSAEYELSHKGEPDGLGDTALTEVDETEPVETEPPTVTDPPIETPPEEPPEESTTEPPVELGSLTGRVCDTSGNNWVVGAEVWIAIDEDGDGVEDRRITTTTDGAGYYTLVDVPAGPATVYVKKGSFTASFDVIIVPGDNALPEPECLDTDLEIAVLEGGYDAIQELLDDLALHYDLIKMDDQTDFLTSGATLAGYDMIFLNCGMSDDWTWFRRGEVGDKLRTFVQGGGSLYASDWAFVAVEAAFPGAIDMYGRDDFWDQAYAGEKGSIRADVIDPSMIALLGRDQADLNYDLAMWAVAEGVGPTTTTLLTGSFPLWPSGHIEHAPLAVELNDGGRVIFTTFHNEPQMTEDMEIILKEIILSL
jgi:hypothetical protein